MVFDSQVCEPPGRCLTECHAWTHTDLSSCVQDRIYKSIMQLGIAVVSVAHHRNLVRYHTHVLHLPGDGKGSWALDEELGVQHTG